MAAWRLRYRLTCLGAAAAMLASCGASPPAPEAAPPPGAPAQGPASSAPAVPSVPPATSQSTAAAQPEVRGAQSVRAAPRAAVTTALQVPPPFRRGAFAQDRQLQVPQGFAIGVFALVPGARSMAMAPWGELLVTQPAGGRIVALRDADGDGAAESQRTLRQGLQCPYGMAFRDGFLYVAQSTKVERFRIDGSELGPAELVVGGLPQSGCGAHHFRPLVFDSTGFFYVAFGSSCNVCVESDGRRGTVWQYTTDGGGREFARGLRNVVDLTINPATGQLWGATNERDELGDDVPPDPVAAIQEGANYGWPYCYWDGGGWKVDTRVPRSNPTCGGLSSYNGIQAHSAPLGITFYGGQQFPPEYAGNAFVGAHGSWNHSQGVGYKVLRIAFDGQTPLPAEDFVAGWFQGKQAGNAWGRPVDVEVGAEGALYVSDDEAGAVYRVTFGG